MTDKRIQARFYRLPSGKEPVRDWLKSLPKSDCFVIGTDIKNVEFGWPIGLPVCRSLGNGLWEVRSNLDRRIARVIFAIDNDTLWLLHGFIKKQQKTPAKDLQLAKQRLGEILKGKRN